MSDTPSQRDYQVLARKYRPTTFEDMIGQDAMVTTLKNAFTSGRIAHAFMLTGVRGIGKTTTARLLARALNYTSEDHDGPSTDLTPLGEHCEAIMASRHMDVLEMDAASRTGVENMREMLDGVRYAPVAARYKVYIIDEVHMLSTGAFNALLKTLEEPPNHAKFVFATTEIRKVPVTVLSRCQRFDLRRVGADSLKAHLAGICETEGVSVSDAGLAMIARAAEGSVRDGLSLLDQALVQGASGDTGEVTGDQVRAMLGLADAQRVVDLFDMVLRAEAAPALTEMRAQYDDGAAPDVVIRDLVDICHEVSRAKILGKAAEFDAAPDQAERLRAMAESTTQGTLTRIWQMLNAAHGLVRESGDPLSAAEMSLIKLCTAADMPPPELAAALIKEMQAGNFSLEHVSEKLASLIGPRTSRPSPGPVPTPETPKPVMPKAPPRARVTITSLSDLVAALDPQKDVGLIFEIENHVREVAVEPGKLTYQPTRGAKAQLTGAIIRKIKALTDELWVVETVSEGGAPTIAEARREAKRAQAEADRAHPAFEHPLLKGAELIEIITRDPMSDVDDIAGETT